jgi:dolichol-phosphate mannosyltransferase
MNDGTTGKNGTVVVIATYNEYKTIGQILERLPYPVIVVDDDSPDGTGIIAQYSGAIVINRPRKSGIASAYYDGFMKALEMEPKYIVQMDAGLTHQPEDVKRLIDKAHEGYELVIGSRFMRPVKHGYRSIISRIATTMMRYIGIKVTDATSGFRCWDAKELLPWIILEPFKAHGFAFQLETLFRASQLTADIAEVPIEYRLTNSSFRILMLFEALKLYIRRFK